VAIDPWNEGLFGRDAHLGQACAGQGVNEMSQHRSFVALILATVVLGACTVDLAPESNGSRIRGSGNLVTREENVRDFDRVEASSAFALDISQGSTYSVVVEADDNLIEYVEVTRRGSILEIGLKSGPRSMTNVTLGATITMPELAGVHLSGACHATIDGFQGEGELDIDLSGASWVTGDIEAGRVRIEVSGASHVDLRGSGEDLRAYVSGASSADLADFPVGDAEIEVSGASQATVNVRGRLDADASGASQVFYEGNPTLGTIRTSGSSTVKPR
jgi:hypothetical protein